MGETSLSSHLWVCKGRSLDFYSNLLPIKISKTLLLDDREG